MSRLSRSITRSPCTIPDSANPFQPYRISPLEARTQLPARRQKCQATSSQLLLHGPLLSEESAQRLWLSAPLDLYVCEADWLRSCTPGDATHKREKAKTGVEHLARKPRLKNLQFVEDIGSWDSPFLWADRIVLAHPSGNFHVPYNIFTRHSKLVASSA